ncbi:MAG: hypothetical protein AVDCRST_MAG29-1637 [uncultured Nocardioidaceae bacterium]|uniref:Sulfotransferase domain-containing protein n=1 Tax=uncultured Nocardioidaceae bacterium TaxID=253824 RepID=A0A6J4LVK6_9ACTN|nr:MAG: hypothetical protein AVDCRST_MAG29-1637 [uncultured Nocardioidaceae bacterium]
MTAGTGIGADSAAASRGPQRVFVHIGPPKTGTSFIQSVLFGNKQRLAGQGVLVPGRSQGDVFAAGADLRQKESPGLRTHGAWNRLAAEATAWPGTSVLSCEWLAFAPSEQVAQIAHSFGSAEVHFVLTLRDLSRIIPAVWQEQVKNGKSFTMTEYLEWLENPDKHDYGAKFWSVHDSTQLVPRWGEAVSPERLHLVTVPGSGAPPEELWHRFASVIGVDSSGHDTSQVRANHGFSPAEAEFVRRVNVELAGRMRKSARGPLVKRLLHDELVEQPVARAKIRLPASAVAWVSPRGDAIIDFLKGAGHPIVGDLEDLRVSPAAVTAGDAEQYTEEEVSASAVASAATLLLQMQSMGVHKRLRAKASRVAKRRAQTIAGGGRTTARDKLSTTAASGLAGARRVAGRVRRAASSS